MSIKSLMRQRNAELESMGMRQGYYLVKNDARHFISSTVDEPSLNRVCSRVLSDVNGWDYWVDYSLGPDVHGNPAWSNVDHTDKFLP